MSLCVDSRSLGWKRMKVDPVKTPMMLRRRSRQKSSKVQGVIAQLEALADTLLDFSDVEEVEVWLTQNNP